MTVPSNGEQPDRSVQEQPVHETLSAIDYLNRAKDRLQNMNVPEVMTSFVLNIVKHPEKVQIHLTRSLRTLVIEFDMHPSDRGKVIGRKGHTIMALRSLMRAVAGASNVEYKIAVVEDEEDQRSSRPSRRGRR